MLRRLQVTKIFSPPPKFFLKKITIKCDFFLKIIYFKGLFNYFKIKRMRHFTFL